MLLARGASHTPKGPGSAEWNHAFPAFGLGGAPEVVSCIAVLTEPQKHQTCVKCEQPPCITVCPLADKDVRCFCCCVAVGGMSVVINLPTCAQRLVESSPSGHTRVNQVGIHVGPTLSAFFTDVFIACNVFCFVCAACGVSSLVWLASRGVAGRYALPLRDAFGALCCWQPCVAGLPQCCWALCAASA